jgi:hypothetical protein
MEWERRVITMNPSLSNIAMTLSTIYMVAFLINILVCMQIKLHPAQCPSHKANNASTQKLDF